MYRRFEGLLMKANVQTAAVIIARNKVSVYVMNLFFRNLLQPSAVMNEKLQHTLNS